MDEYQIQALSKLNEISIEEQAIILILVIILLYMFLHNMMKRR